MSATTVGSICYSIRRGLGNLCRDFYLNKIIDEVCIVRHSGIPMQEDWYPNAPIYEPRDPNPGMLKQFCDRHKVMLFFETPFDWNVITYCRAKGIKTAIVTMYECTPEHLSKEHVPDYWLCPSLLDMTGYFAQDLSKATVNPFDQAKGWLGNTAIYTPLPIEYPWRKREKALHFVHNGGYLGVRGREGTENLIQAMQYVKSPIQLTIRVQENVSKEGQSICAADPRITYKAESLPREELYLEGDVAVGAQKWNGCSLPLQEAFAAGMGVMNTNRYPMNSWLPKDLLIPVNHYIEGRIAGRFLPFQEAIVTPQDIAQTIDTWYGEDISKYSLLGKKYAEQNSWKVLGPLYQELLRG